MATLVIAAILWGIGWWLLYRIRSAARGRPLPGTPPVRGTAGEPRLSIIIPARNEQANLPRLLRSIGESAPRCTQVIVANDNSTDQTASVARAHGAAVVSVPPLPNGWRGKTWACHHGATAAEGDVFLFLDADTWFETGGLARLCAMYTGEALSLGPYHITQRPSEQLSAFFNLLMVSGTIPDRLFGPMLMIDRACYQRIGGHQSVRDRTLENFHLALRLREEKLPLKSIPGWGIISSRMYPGGLGDLYRGWVKGFASGAAGTPAWLLFTHVAWLSGMTMVLGLLPWFWPATILYGLFAGQLALLLREVGRFRWYTYVFYPVPLLFFFVVFAVSLIRRGRTVSWKGREILAD